MSEKEKLEKENKNLRDAIKWVVHHMGYQTPETPLPYAWMPCHSRLTRALEE